MCSAHHLGNGAGVLGCGQLQFAQLAQSEIRQLARLGQQSAGPFNDQLGADHSRSCFLRGGSCRRMLGADVGSGVPGRLIGHGIERLQKAGHGFEKGARLAFKRRQLACPLFRGPQADCSETGQGGHGHDQNPTTSHGRRLT